MQGNSHCFGRWFFWFRSWFGFSRFWLRSFGFPAVNASSHTNVQTSCFLTGQLAKMYALASCPIIASLLSSINHVLNYVSLFLYLCGHWGACRARGGIDHIPLLPHTLDAPQPFSHRHIHRRFGWFGYFFSLMNSRSNVSYCVVNKKWLLFQVYKI